jgi:hypothetical protein
MTFQLAGGATSEIGRVGMELADSVSSEARQTRSAGQPGPNSQLASLWLRMASVPQTLASSAKH